MLTNIILRAPVYSQSGYGAHSKDIAMCLWNSQQFNVSILPTGWGGSSVTTNTLTLKEKEALEFMCNNRLHEGVEFIFIHVGIPTEFQKVSKFNVGITAGLESDSINQDWVNGCNQMDLVIVPSNVIRDIFIKCGVKCKVEVVEEGVDTQIFNEKPVEITNNIFDEVDTPHNLLSIGQWLQGGVGEDRKGIGLLINTFLKAFKDDKKVGLILKTHITNNSSVDYYYVKERLKELKGNLEFPKIYLLHGELSTTQLVNLYKHPKVNGFVSLTSGEGWFRPLAESIACDLPTIVTGWGGHMHYVNSDYVKTVNYSLKTVPRSALMQPCFSPGMAWAYPDVEDAKRKMRFVIENSLSTKKKAVEYGEIFRKIYNKEIVYSKLVSILDKVSYDVLKGNSIRKIEIEKV